VPTAATRAELLKGVRFGQHEVVRLIGHGATASVFEGRHAALGKRVALKVLHEHLAANPEVSSRFVREGQVAAQLSHPGIVDVLDVGVQHGLPYLVMELLEGHDLRAELDAKVKLPIAEALAVVVPLASALVHAHERGALHRDLKPANVFLAQDHRGDVAPKIVDFGLSKIVGEEQDKNPLTSTDAVVGTILYMAPEQTYGSRLASPRSDEYSLAAILYEALAGAPPFSERGFYALIEAIRNAPLRPLDLVDPRVPEPLAEAISRALHRDDQKRFPNMRAFGEALLPFADERTRAAWGRDFTSSVPAQVAAAATPAAVVSPAPPDAVTQAETSAVRRIAPLPCAPGTSPFHIKGMAWRGFVHLTRHGVPGGLDAVCDALDDPRLKDFVRQTFLAASWYDILPLLPAMGAVARVLGRPLDHVTRLAAISQCRYDASNVFRLMYSTGRVEDIVERVPRLGSRYYDFGAASGWHEGPGHVALRQTLVPEYLEPWFVPMHAAYSEEAARVLGAKEVESIERRDPQRPTAHAGFPVMTVTSDVRWR
jgi:serine/threonine-protein kinase